MAERLPHIGELLTDDVEAVLEHGEVLIVGSRTPEVISAIEAAGPEQLIIDLVRLPEATAMRDQSNYRGVAW